MGDGFLLVVAGTYVRRHRFLLVVAGTYVCGIDGGGPELRGNRCHHSADPPGPPRKGESCVRNALTARSGVLGFDKGPGLAWFGSCEGES